MGEAEKKLTPERDCEVPTSAVVRRKEGAGLQNQASSPRPGWRKGASHVESWGKKVLAEGTVIQRPSERGVSADQEGGRNTASEADEWPQ